MLTTDRAPVRGPGLDAFTFPDDQALLVVGDVHGQNTALRGLLAGLGRMPTPGLRRTLVFLGDLIDRGPDSPGCLHTALFDAATLAEADEIVCLPGNHELCLADAIDLARGAERADLCAEDALVWLQNGGMEVLDQAFAAKGRALPADMLDAIAGLAEMLPAPGHSDFAAMIRTWPSHVRLGDALCVHAGLAPRRPQAVTLDLPQHGHRYTDRHWAWIRDPFLAWQEGWPVDGPRADGPGSLVLHGHTIPRGVAPRALEHGDDVRNIFCRMQTHARICLDGGAARGVGVAGALVTAAGVRLAHHPA